VTDPLNETSKKARDYVNDKSRVEQLLTKAYAKFKASAPRLAEVAGDLETLFRMLRAWTKGVYRDIGISSLLVILGAVIYFVNPFDAIPDLIPFLGFTDDISLIALAVTRVKSEIDRFRNWENEVSLDTKSTPVETPSISPD
jgi:uncharacterized membrane protein YkvA (DUF1232 family)